MPSVWVAHAAVRGPCVSYDIYHLTDDALTLEDSTARTEATKRILAVTGRLPATAAASTRCMQLR